MVRASLCVSIAVAFFVLQGCGPAKVEPQLSLTARPRSIDSKTGKSVVAVSAFDALGKAGTGKVKVSSTAGSLAEGEELTLTAGEAETDFTCTRATDAACTGTITITAEWTSDGVKTTASVNVTITEPPVIDAGFDAGVIQPTDAGVVDAGFDISTVDGGTIGEYTVSLAFEKAVLLRGTGDSMRVTAHVAKTASPGVGVQGAPVVFTVTGGASYATTATPSKMATTDASGDAVVTLYVGTATSSVVVHAASFDSTAFVGVSVVNVAKIEYLSDPRTKSKLTIRSTGRDSSTAVFFKVTDSTSKPVPGIDVNFDIGVGSAAGCTVTNSARTDTDGIAQTILASGEARGAVTVKAVVAATAGSANELLAAAAFEVIIGRPSDGNFNVQCSRKVLAALQIVTPPRNDLSTTCTVSMSDRYGAILPFAVDVLWSAEAGLLQSSTQSDLLGRSTNTYGTGNNLPSPVEPFVGEPFDGTRNPRDMFATIIAATSGEEEFWDRAGDGGVGNGVWDPGEWFVDQPEPFVDSNDNGLYDNGEKFLDTERLDCATGIKLPKNNNWDGPNGCWDSTTLIWRSAHIVYSGNLALGTGESGPFLIFNPPSTVNNDSTVQVNFSWFDAHYNRLSNDNGTVSVTVRLIAGTRGGATVNNLDTGEAFGHTFSYYTARGTESAGAITETGTCNDADRITAPTSGERCFRRFKIAAWRTSPLAGSVLLVGPAVNNPESPSTSTFQLTGGNSYSTQVKQTFSVTYPK